MRYAAVVFAVLTLTASPAAAAANKEHLQLLAEIRMLQEQVQQLQAMIGTLTDAQKTVITRLDEQATGSRKAIADQTLAITNMGDNVRVLREKADETNVRISTVSQEIDALRQAIASQPAQTAVPAGTVPGGEPGAAAPPPQATPTPGGAGTISPQRMYETSFAHYRARQCACAV